MFFNYRHLDELGYKDNGYFTNLSSYSTYRKYFVNNTFVYFDSFTFEIEVVITGAEEMKAYKTGKIGLSADPNRIGQNTISGKPIMRCYSKVINQKDSVIKNRKQLKALLEEAETVAKSLVLVRGKMLEV